MSAARDFGDVVHFPGGPLTTYFFNHPDHIKYVLQDNNHNYSKQHRVTDLLKPFVSEGLLTSDGEVWRRRRRRSGHNPRFIGQRFALLATLMTEATLVLATVAQQYRLHLVPSHPVEPYPIFTL